VRITKVESLEAATASPNSSIMEGERAFLVEGELRVMRDTESVTL
jgi:hypothetical protein